MTARGEAPSGVGPLTGFTVGVTAARRAEELGAILERRGATVVHAPAIRIVPLADDTELVTATRAILARRPDVVVVTTGIGFRGWIEAADGWGLAEPLLASMRQARILTRGPKARGAVRAAGLTDHWSPSSESTTEALRYLLAEGVDGARVAVQLHGEPLPDFCAALTRAGAEVVTVPVYRWCPPADPQPLQRLVEATVAGTVDAVTFTSAPAAASMLARADDAGCGAELAGALRRDVLAMCVGSVSAGPLQTRRIPSVWPHRARMGAMVRRLSEELPARARQLPVAGHRLELRGQGVLVDGELRMLPPTSMALLRALAHQPGRVVSRAELLPALPGDGDDEHAVETAVGRLRSSLGEPGMVQTVVKRGYRLALDRGGCGGSDSSRAC